MRIQNISLSNYRSYEDVSVSFDEDGLVLIYGDNGAGKSSLLESIFAGLYMSDSTKYMNGNVNLDSLVRNEKEESSIRLVFQVGDKEYDIKWVVSVRETSKGKKASTKVCRMKGSDIDGAIEGFREVREKVVDVIGMDAQSFVNSVYVQQDEIARIVDTNLDRRKKIVDGLLGLSKIDNYIDRMDKVRMEYGAQKRKIDGILEEKMREKREIPEKKSIESQIKRLNESLESKKKKLEKLDTLIQKTEKERKEIQSKIENYKSNRASVQSIRNKVQELEDKRNSSDSKINEIKKEIESNKNEIKKLESSFDYENTDKEHIKKEITEKTNEIAEISEDLQNLEDSLDVTNSEIKDKERDIVNLKEDIESLKNRKKNRKEEISKISNDIDDLERKVENIQDEIKSEEDSIFDLCNILNIDSRDMANIKNSLIPKKKSSISKDAYENHRQIGRLHERKESYEHILDESECPICSSSVTELPDSNSSIEKIEEYIRKLENSTDSKSQELDIVNELEDSIDDYNELKSEISSLKEEISEKNSQVENKEQDITSLSDSIENMEKKLESSREEMSDMKAKKKEQQESIESRQKKKSDLESRKEYLDNVLTKINKIDNLTSVLEENQRQLENYREIRETRQQEYLEKKQELSKLEEDLSSEDLKDMEEELSNKSEDLESVRDNRSKFSDELDDLRAKITEKNQRLERLESIEERCRELRNKKQKANEKESDSEQVISMYKGLKTDLRRENIGILNKYANKIFSSVYTNKIYQRLNISEDYEISLVTGDGLSVSPQDLSGGEKTIISLSIRAGIYKLLVDQRGKVDNLPPIILDEPTTYLDDEHITNLQNVIDEIRSWDVPQVFVVSHRENMIENADASYRIDKKPTSESSKVTKTR